MAHPKKYAKIRIKNSQVKKKKNLGWEACQTHNF